MFSTHQPPIMAFARENADHMAAVGAFVIHTARVPLARAVTDFQKWWSNGDTSALWDWKHEAVREMWRDRQARFERLEMLQHDRDAMLHEVAHWTGFGLEKGGFLLQLAYGMSGCLDTHNKRRLSIPERKFDAWRFTRARTMATRMRLVSEYHETVDACGGTAVLWDEWCVFIFERSPNEWRDSDQVSAWHALAFDVEPADGQDDDVPF